MNLGILETVSFDNKLIDCWCEPGELKAALVFREDAVFGAAVCLQCDSRAFA